MSDTRIFTLGENGGSNSMAPLIASLCQNRGLDPNMVAAMMNNNRGNGGWGDGSAWWIIILLIFGWGGFGNGFGGGFGGRGSAQGLADLGNLVNNDAGRELLMSAIQGNGTAISQLASTVHCDQNALMGAISNVSQSICQLGNQMGQNTSQVLTALMQGNNALASQLAQCCCDNRLAICQQTNTLQNAINGVNVGVERGFSSLGYALAEQGCQTRQNSSENTRAILAKLDAMEDSRKDREIATLTAQLTAANSRAERQTELAPIYKQLADIACKQMPTFPMPYCPAAGNYVPVNYGINVNPLATTQCGGCC